MSRDYTIAGKPVHLMTDDELAAHTSKLFADRQAQPFERQRAKKKGAGSNATGRAPVDTSNIEEI